MSKERLRLLNQAARFFRHKVQVDLVLNVVWESPVCPPGMENLRSKFEQTMQAGAIADQIRMEEFYNKMGEELCQCMERAAHPDEFLKSAVELGAKILATPWPGKRGDAT